MVKGSIGKETLTKLIVSALGDKFVCVQDKKIYCMVDDGDNGEIQVAISMTVPKTQVSACAFDASDGEPKTAAPTRTELSSEDAEKVKNLMDSLGVTPSHLRT